MNLFKVMVSGVIAAAALTTLAARADDGRIGHPGIARPLSYSDFNPADKCQMSFLAIARDAVKAASGEVVSAPISVYARNGQMTMFFSTSNSTNISAIADIKDISQDDNCTFKSPAIVRSSATPAGVAPFYFQF